MAEKIQIVDDEKCFACGLKNSEGLRLHWQLENKTMCAVYTPEAKYQSWQNVLHGGILATLLDEAMTRLVCVLFGPAVTAELTVRYLKPAKIGQKIYIQGEIIKESKKLFETKASIHVENTSGPSHSLCHRKSHQGQSLNTFWKLLRKTKRISIKSSIGQAEGTVLVTKENGRSLLFQERGIWINQKISFYKMVRWKIDPLFKKISLEHLHYGDLHPVHLFDLVQTSPNSLESCSPHLCAKDCYSGKVFCTEKKIHLFFQIQGPYKNETVHHIYS